MPQTEPMSAEECPHKRLYRWISSDGTTFAYCAKCSKKFGPHKTWEEVRIEAGRKPSISYKDKLIASTLQAAADRAQAFYKSDCGGCGEWCDEPPRCNREEESEHCHHIRSLRKAILAPLDKTDKGE